MTIFTLLLTAEQPLLLTSSQGDPNSGVSYPYIPGSMLRGALIGRYIRIKDIRDHRLDLYDATVQSLFFDHGTRYLNAYLYADASGTLRRMLPMSHAWRKEKRAEFNHKTLEVVDATFANAPLPNEPKPVSGDGCWIDGAGVVTLATVQRHINIHNQRDRKRGRGVEGSGAIFRYEAIAPGQTFQAVIICDAAEAVSELQAVLTPGTLWLGGSRSAGYGRVQVRDVQKVSKWHEVGTDTSRRTQGNPGELHITLLSDLIIRDSVTGQYTAALPLANLEQRLGLKNLMAKPERSFRALTHVGGFNRTWGLPLPQTVAIAAGSVFTCTFAGALDPQRVAALEREGLGERRAEGFGRVAINWRPFSSAFTLHKSVPVTTVALPVTLNASSQSIADAMAQRLLRQRMDARLEELVGRTRIVDKIKISNTQLSRLHIVARRGLEHAEFTQVEQLLNNLPKNAREQFDQTQIEDGDQRISLREWLDRQLRMAAENWQEFVSPVALIAGLTPLAPTDMLMREYTLRLIMAVARQSVKEVH